MVLRDARGISSKPDCPFKKIVFRTSFYFLMFISSLLTISSALSLSLHLFRHYIFRVEYLIIYVSSLYLLLLFRHYIFFFCFVTISSAVSLSLHNVFKYLIIWPSPLFDQWSLSLFCAIYFLLHRNKIVKIKANKIYSQEKANEESEYRYQQINDQNSSSDLEICI